MTLSSIPLVCLPIALVLVYAPKVPMAVAMSKEPSGYDNRQPREQQSRLTGANRRAAAAHANGFESFPAFGVGVLATQVTHANATWAAIFSLTYIAARTLYPILYIRDQASLRSLVWLVGFVCCIALMILAAVT